jgi:anti-sigma B factor antagonist
MVPGPAAADVYPYMIALRYSDFMEFRALTRDDISIISVLGRIDASSAPDLEDALNQCVNAGSGKMVLDFSGVDYVSSAGLRVLLSVRKLLVPLKGELVIAGLRPFVREVFDMTGFSRIFPLYNTTDEACGHFS